LKQKKAVLLNSLREKVLNFFTLFETQKGRPLLRKQQGQVCGQICGYIDDRFRIRPKRPKRSKRPKRPLKAAKDCLS
jgi:hypothetical protein